MYLTACHIKTVSIWPMCRLCGATEKATFLVESSKSNLTILHAAGAGLK